MILALTSLALFAACASSSTSGSGDKVLLTDIKALTLSKGVVGACCAHWSIRDVVPVVVVAQARGQRNDADQVRERARRLARVADALRNSLSCARARASARARARLLASTRILKRAFPLCVYVCARAAMKQLNCVKGACALDYQPDTVQCLNMGTDGVDVQWKCEADLDSRVKFGHIDVSCEGYSSPNDPYVLKGSCGYGAVCMCVCVWVCERAPPIAKITVVVVDY